MLKLCDVAEKEKCDNYKVRMKISPRSVKKVQKENHEIIINKINQLYETLFLHNGYGEMKIEMRILKKGQKEVILHCGKQYRFVVDYSTPPE